VDVLFDPACQEPLRAGAWDPERALALIDRIVGDAEAHFSPRTWWPLHPRDIEPGEPTDVPSTTLYFGAAGVVWALDRLRPTVAAQTSLDALLADHHEWLRAFGYADETAAYLIGDTPIELMAFRREPTAARADRLAELIAGNREHPARELLDAGPARQPLHVSRRRPRLRGHRVGPDSWTRAAGRRRLGRVAGRDRGDGEPHGHARGRPGELASLAARRREPDDRAVLPRRAGLRRLPGRPAGQRARRTAARGRRDDLGGRPAGQGPRAVPRHRRQRLRLPPAPPAHRRRGVARAARAFAMHGIGQVEEACDRYGHLRFSLWTGDLGFALYLRDCVDAGAGFPTLDVF
jgi:hypothetical protein